jgi:hypothetical protein
MCCGNIFTDTLPKIGIHIRILSVFSEQTRYTEKNNSICIIMKTSLARERERENSAGFRSPEHLIGRHISLQTEGHSFGDHLSSESVRLTPPSAIKASIVLCSVSL